MEQPDNYRGFAFFFLLTTLLIVGMYLWAINSEKRIYRQYHAAQWCIENGTSGKVVTLVRKEHWYRCAIGEPFQHSRSLQNLPRIDFGELVEEERSRR